MTDKPDNTGRDHAGRWRSGVSGNPDGRPTGSRVKALRHLDMIFEGEGERLSRKCIEMALAGDTTALRLCLERAHPPRKGRLVHIDLPPLNTASDVAEAMSTVAREMAEGELSPDEAAQVVGLLEAKRRASRPSSWKSGCSDWRSGADEGFEPQSYEA